MLEAEHQLWATVATVELAAREDPGHSRRVSSSRTGAFAVLAASALLGGQGCRPPTRNAAPIAAPVPSATEGRPRTFAEPTVAPAPRVLAPWLAEAVAREMREIHVEFRDGVS